MSAAHGVGEDLLVHRACCCLRAGDGHARSWCTWPGLFSFPHLFYLSVLIPSPCSSFLSPPSLFPDPFGSSSPFSALSHLHTHMSPPSHFSQSRVAQFYTPFLPLSLFAASLLTLHLPPFCRSLPLPLPVPLPLPFPQSLWPSILCIPRPDLDFWGFNEGNWFCLFSLVYS